MNPVAQQALLRILVWALTFGAGWFVREGIWTDDNATEYVLAAATALLTGMWWVWNHYRHQILHMTRAVEGVTTMEDAKLLIANGIAADPNTPQNVAPVLTVKATGEVIELEDVADKLDSLL